MIRPKIVVIGLDGATWKIFSPLIKQGKLPFLQSQMNAGASGVLMSTTPSVSAAAWATFETGVNPGQHGIFNFYQRRDRKNPDKIIDSRSLKTKKLWHYLEDANLTSLLVNTPLSYPVEPIHGVLISSFLTPLNGRFVYPPSLEPKLKSMGYQIDIQINNTWGSLPHTPLTQSDINQLVKDALHVCQTRIKAFRYLATHTAADFFFLYFKTSDFIQHLLYNHPPVDRYWHRLDSMLGKLYQDFHQSQGSNQYWFVISDHGFHPSATYQFSPYVWYKSLFPPKTTPQQKPVFWQVQHRLNQTLKKAGVNITSLKWIKKLRSHSIQQIESKTKSSWIESTGFYPTIEGIYLFNRQRNQKFTHQLIKAARQLTYYNYKIFNLVEPASKLYHGSQIKNAPDIVWIPNEDFTINPSILAEELISPRNTLIKGEHYSDRKGIFTLTGPDVKAKSTVQLNLIDIPFIVLKLFGIDPTLNLEGHFPTKLFNRSPKKSFSKHKKAIDSQGFRPFELENIKL